LSYVLPGLVLDSPVAPAWSLFPTAAATMLPAQHSDGLVPGGTVPTLALCWVAAWRSGMLDNFTAANIRHFHKAYPEFMANATLWVDEATQVPQDVQTLVRVRKLPPGYDGKIGKTYALRHSEPLSTSHVLFLDGDTWVCPGWLAMLTGVLADSTVDVVWSMTPIACGRYVDFRCDVAMNESIRNDAREMAAFRQFYERNSGTVFAIRRSGQTTQWLSDAAELYPKMVQAGVVLGDQPALRESLFLHRHVIKEVLLPERVGCRANLWKLPFWLHWKGRCPCKCDCTTCLFIHHKTHMPECARELGVWEPAA